MTEILNLSCQSVAPCILQEKLRRQKLERKEICKLSPSEFWMYDTSRFDPIISWYLLDEHGEITESGDMMLGCIGSPYVFSYIKEELFKKKKFPVPVVFSNIQCTVHNVPVMQQDAPVTDKTTEQLPSLVPAETLCSTGYNNSESDDSRSGNIIPVLQHNSYDTRKQHTYVHLPGAASYVSGNQYSTAISYPQYYNHSRTAQQETLSALMSHPANHHLYTTTGTSPPSPVF